MSLLALALVRLIGPLHVSSLIARRRDGVSAVRSKDSSTPAPTGARGRRSIQARWVPVNRPREAVSCGGVNYVIQSAGGPNLYRAVPAKDLAGIPDPTKPASHKQFDIAWTKLMRTLAITVPGNDQRIGVASQRIRKAVR